MTDHQPDPSANEAVLGELSAAFAGPEREGYDFDDPSIDRKLGIDAGLNPAILDAVAAGQICARDFVTDQAPLSNLKDVLRLLMNSSGRLKTAIIP